MFLWHIKKEGMVKRANKSKNRYLIHMVLLQGVMPQLNS